MSSTSNKLSHSRRLLANKPMNEANAKGEVLKVNGNTIYVKNCALSFEEDSRVISEIKSDDEKLQLVINRIMKHCFELLEMKTRSANVDFFKIIGSATTGEHNIWWIGGFRPSQLLQVILPKLEDVCSKQQISDILNLGQSCEQAEHALAQGMERLHQIIDKRFEQNYVTQQLSFFKQADFLRQEFLHQFCHLLTICQHAQFIVALKEHLHNPRSSL